MLLPNAPHPAAGKAGTLLRLSGLPVDRDPLSPEIQREMTRDAAGRNGDKIDKEYLEFVSAADPDAHRPAYGQAIEDLLNQVIETLYVAALDRLSRRGAGQVDSLIEELKRVGGRIVFVKEGMDSTKPNGRLAIALYAELARAEAENASWRLTQWHATMRRKGLWSQRRPFGFLVEDYKLQPHPDEGSISRRMVDEFLAGTSYRSIARQLNTDGIPAPLEVIRAEAKAKGHRVTPRKNRSGKWTGSTVAALLRKPSLAALISHKARLVYDDEGAPISCGEGIVTMGERARILAEMERRRAIVRETRGRTQVGKRSGGGRSPKYLLSGFVQCAHCHYAMAAHFWREDGYNMLHYVCTGYRLGQGCNGAFIPADFLEAEVVERTTKRLAACEPDDPLLSVIVKRWVAQAIPDDQGERRRLEDALAATKQTISDLWDDRYERHLFQSPEDITEWERRLARASSQRDAIQKQKDALGERQGLDINALLDTELSREGWKQTSFARKRDLLGLAMNAVLVRGARRGQRPMRDRVAMVWAHEELPEREPPDEPPVNPREIIAQLVAEEHAGERPRLTAEEAAELVGVIRKSWAMVLLKEERAKYAQPTDEQPPTAREVIAGLVAEERAGERPRLTGPEAARIVGTIRQGRANDLLRAERARQTQPTDEPKLSAREVIAGLVAEERAGERPRLTGPQAARIVGTIGEFRAMALLREERAKLQDGRSRPAQPTDEPKLSAREVIAGLVAEERAGERPRLTGKEAAKLAGGIGETYAHVLLRIERSRLAEPTDENLGTRTIIARLVAEERAGKQPTLTPVKAAELVGTISQGLTSISPAWAKVLLRHERVKQSREGTPLEGEP